MFASINDYRGQCLMMNLLVIIFVSLTMLHTFAQNAVARTQVKSSEEAQKHQQFFYLCKVWGYLYYYHPSYENGTRLQEDVLRTHIDTILASSGTSPDTIAIRSLVASLMKDFGVRPASRSLPPNSWNNLGMIPNTDFHWLRDSVFDEYTRRELEAVPLVSLPLQKKYFIKIDTSGKATIYFKPDLMNTMIRKTESLMALFVFWNAFNYFSPHKKFVSKNWDSVLVEYIPQFLRVTTNAEYVRLLMKLGSQLNDSHVYVSSPDMPSVLGKYTIPLRFVVLGSQVVVQESLCCDSLKLKGLVVKEINGTPIDSLLARNASLVSASNGAVFKRGLARLLRFSHERNASFVFFDGVERKRVVIECTEQTSTTPQQPRQQKSFYRLLETSDKDTIVYVDLGVVQKSDVLTVFQILAGKRGAIFDLRSYPNGILRNLMQGLASPRPYMAMSLMELQYPGYNSKPQVLTCGRKEEYLGKIVVLANEYTQSQGESTVQALRTIPGMKIVGSQTAGANGEVMKVVLPMNATVYFTHNAVFDMEMKSMQGVGILPDVEVRPTVEGIRAGRDEVLEKGVEVLRGLLKKNLNSTNDK
ncbi:MAG: S41 family peptidase [Candidatus Kapaibacteriota bacterium]